MNKEPSFTAQVVAIERKRSSVNGNPRFLVTFDNGQSLPTQVDGSVGYSISNPEHKGTRQDVWVERGNIVHIREAGARRE